jgi:hypothetical protein
MDVITKSVNLEREEELSDKPTTQIITVLNLFAFTLSYDFANSHDTD